jgi:hypothetical protein
MSGKTLQSRIEAEVRRRLKHTKDRRERSALQKMLRGGPEMQPTAIRPPELHFPGLMLVPQRAPKPIFEP